MRMSLREYVYMVRRLVVVHAHDIYLVDLVSGRLVVIHAVRLRVYIFIFWGTLQGTASTTPPINGNAKVWCLSDV